jgi:DNA-binding CsgD family transcriptional regulator
MEGASQGQVVLYAKKAAVAQPIALVDVSLEVNSTLTTLGVQGHVGQDALIADLDHLLNHPLETRPRFPESDEELRDLLQAVAGLRFRKLADRVVIGVGIPEFRSGHSYFLRACTHGRIGAAHELNVFGRHPREYCGSGLEYMRALTDFGATLRRGGRRADAREPLRNALELARRNGALAIARRAHEELEATGEKLGPLIAVGVESLTPSERRIAKLAAEGLTNREIAQTLFLSVKTVESHLGGTYRKLDVRSREDLPRALEGA